MSPKHQSKLEFFNSYGLVFEDKFYLHRYNYRSFIDIDDLNKIKLVEKRVLTPNYLLFITALLILFIGFFNNQNMLIIKGFSSLFAFVFILSSIVYKKCECSILMVTSSLQPLHIGVENDFKNEAKEIISQINKKIESKKTTQNLHS